MVKRFDITDDEDREINIKAQKKAMYDILVANYKQQLLDGTAEMTPRFEKFYDKYLDRKNKSKSTHVLITVNPRSDDIQLLKKCTEKFVKHKWIQAYAYCFEQRSEGILFKPEDEQPIAEGYHVHILVRKDDYEPCKVVRETKSSFKKIDMSEKAINFKYCKPEAYMNFYNYLLKNSKVLKMEQRQKCIVDKIFRKDNNLENIYEKGDLKPNLTRTCRDSEKSI